MLLTPWGLAVMIWEVVRDEWRAWKRAGEFLARLEQLGNENEAATSYADMN